MTSANIGEVDSHRRLIGDLLQAFEAGARVRAVLPPGRRADVLDALAPLMLDPDRLARYVSALDAERDRRGLDGPLRLLPVPGLPVDAVAERGLSALGDDELADLAIRPAALACLSEYLGERMAEGRVGDPWWAEVTRLADGDAPPGVRTGTKHVLARHRRAILHWGGRVGALAASLLVGVLLGTTAFHGGPDGGGGSFRADVDVLFDRDRERGAAGAPRLKIGSDSVGFVTVIALSPGPPEQPVVFPISPSRDLRVGPGSLADTGPFPDQARGATVARVVVTKTPAADSLDKELLDARFSAEDVRRLEEEVDKLLRSKGHERFTVRRVDIARTGR